MAGLNEMSVIYQYINDSFFIPVFVLCGGGGVCFVCYLLCLLCWVITTELNILTI